MSRIKKIFAKIFGQAFIKLYNMPIPQARLFWFSIMAAWMTFALVLEIIF